MGYTIAEKILMRASGSDHAEPGEIVNARVDVAMSHDNAALVSKVFKEIGRPKVWDANRIVIPIDHRVPANNIKTAEGHKKIREFAREQQIKHFYDVKEGVCHQIMPEFGHVVPGELIAEELRAVHAALGEIVGEMSSDALLGEIFANFCIGK